MQISICQTWTLTACYANQTLHQLVCDYTLRIYDARHSRDTKQSYRSKKTVQGFAWSKILTRLTEILITGPIIQHISMPLLLRKLFLASPMDHESARLWTMKVPAYEFF
jgi:hypothetical protein